MLDLEGARKRAGNIEYSAADSVAHALLTVQAETLEYTKNQYVIGECYGHDTGAMSDRIMSNIDEAVERTRAELAKLDGERSERGN